MEQPVNATANATANGIPRKRRKQVKSCLFCRKRKLKCNKIKPMCQQCSNRKLPKCVYLSEFNYDVISVEELFDKHPNVKLLDKITHLQSNITNNNNSGNNNKSINPLSTFKTAHWKDNKLYIFGATSWRTIITADGTKFQLEFLNLWQKLKPKSAKEAQQCSDLFFAPMKSDFRQNLDGTVSDTSLTQLLCTDLPKFSKIKLCLEQFFNGPFHEFLHILDPKKTFRDLYECFIFNQQNDTIIDLRPTDNTNFFKIGIILYILILTTYDNTSHVPESLIRYCIQINGAICMDITHTERAQFLLMCCYYKIHHGEYSRWDGTQIIPIVAQTVECCVSLGLDNVGKWYRNKENIVGDLKYLENTMIWTLFTDVLTSFDIGKPPILSNDMFSIDLYESTLLRNQDQLIMPRNQLFLDFIRIGRKSLTNLNSVNLPYNNEDIDTFIVELHDYLNTNFPDISTFTSMGRIFAVDPFEIMVLSSTLGMLFNFHNIKRAFYKDISIPTKNGMFKYGILATSLCVNTLLSMFEADKVAYPDCVRNREKLPPYLNLSLSLVNSLFVRVISEFYSAFMARLTLQQRGYVVLNSHSNHENDLQICLEDSTIMRDRYHCFMCVIRKFKEVLDQLFKPEWDELHQLMETSYSLHSLIVLERVARQLLDQGLSSREQIELHWQKQGVDLNHINPDLLAAFTNEVWDDYASNSKTMWSMTPDDIVRFDLGQPPYTQVP
ncbi:transcription factor Pdr8p [Monosporozyma servazzii]